MNNKIYEEIYIYILILAIIYFFISKISKEKLLSLLIIIIITIIIGIYIYYNDIEKNKINKIYNTNIDKNIKNISQLNDNNYNNIVPNNLKYLKYDDKLIKLILNIEFINEYSKSIYAELLINLDYLNKIYIYILSDRYEIESNLQNFFDIRNNILEILYSLYVLLPSNSKKIYGLNKYNEIDKTIKKFIIHTRKKINIIINYGKYNKKIILNENNYRSYNDIKNKGNILP